MSWSRHRSIEEVQRAKKFLPQAALSRRFVNCDSREYSWSQASAAGQSGSEDESGEEHDDSRVWFWDLGTLSKPSARINPRDHFKRIAEQIAVIGRVSNGSE